MYASNDFHHLLFEMEIRTGECLYEYTPVFLIVKSEKTTPVRVTVNEPGVVFPAGNTMHLVQSSLTALLLPEGKC